MHTIYFDSELNQKIFKYALAEHVENCSTTCPLNIRVVRKYWKRSNIGSNGKCIASSDDKNCQFSDFISFMNELVPYNT